MLLLNVLSRSFLAVFLLQIIAVTLATKEIEEQCTFDDEQCLISCPVSGVQDFEILKLDYRAPQSNYGSSYNELYASQACDQQKHFFWSIGTLENSTVLQRKPTILGEVTVPTLYIKCDSQYFVDYKSVNSILMNTPFVCSLLHKYNQHNGIEHQTTEYVANTVLERPKDETEDAIGIALSKSSLFALKNDRVSVYHRTTETSSSLPVQQTVTIPTSILQRRRLSSVSVNGDWMAVGGEGIVFLLQFSEGGWFFHSMLERSSDTWFGYSVAVSGSTLFISQQTTSEVFVYTLSSATSSSWILTQTLTGIEGELFGFSLAIDGDVALIGVPRADVVYCYQRTEGKWTLQSKILPHAQDNNVFSHALTLSGHTAVIADDQSAHVYTWVNSGDGAATWQYQHSVTDMKSVEAVALSGDVLMILTSSTTVKVYNIASRLTSTKTVLAHAKNTAPITMALSLSLRTTVTSQVTPLSDEMSLIDVDCVWFMITMCVILAICARLIFVALKRLNEGNPRTKEIGVCIVQMIQSGFCCT